MCVCVKSAPKMCNKKTIYPVLDGVELQCWQFLAAIIYYILERKFQILRFIISY